MVRAKQGSAAKAKTPQPDKQAKPTPLRSGPKSAPPAKRKKLAEELKDELSDDDFEMLLGKVKDVEKQKRLKGLVTPVQKDDLEGESEDDDSEDEDDTLPILKMADLEDEDDEEDDEDYDEDEDNDDDDDDDDDESMDDEDDDDEEEDEDADEEEASPKVVKKSPASKELPTKSKKSEAASKKDQAKGKKTAVKKDKQTKKQPAVQAGNLPLKNLRGTTPELLLFIKNLPQKVQPKDLESLCPDATALQLSQKGQKAGFAFVQFSTEAAVGASIKNLKGKKLGANELTVDFVGPKSKNKPATPKKSEPADRDPCKLYMTGFGRTMDMETLKKLFPTASEHHLPLKKKNKNKPCGFAFIQFKSEAACKKAHDAIQGKAHQGVSLTVLYAEKKVRQTPGQKRKPDATSAKKEGPVGKKAKATPQKQTKVVEEVEEDDDDDDDDEEEDDDDVDNVNGAGDMDSDDDDDDDDEGDDDDDDDNDDDDDE